MKKIQDLKTLQKHMMDGFWSGYSEEMKELIRAVDGISAESRLDINKSTVIFSLIDNLKITYPGIFALLGEKYTESICYEYLKDMNHLPKFGTMMEFGREFPKFLSNFASSKIFLII